MAKGGEHLERVRIDSLRRAVDEDFTRRLLSPRRKGSRWSGVNKARIAALVTEGRMQPSGLALVEAAWRGLLEWILSARQPQARGC